MGRVAGAGTIGELAAPASTEHEAGELWVLDAAAAQLAAWALLAILNQVMITLRLPAPPSLGVGLLHRAYDAGQLLFLGVLSRAGVRAAEQWLPRLTRFRAWAPASLFSVVFGVGLCTVAADLTSLAARMELERWMLTVVVAFGFALLLDASYWAWRFANGWRRWALVATGSLLAGSNAFLLESDYFGLHLMLGWLAALLIGQGLTGVAIPALPRVPAMLGLSCLSLAASSAVLLAPRSEVQRRLCGLTSSVAAPFIARILPERAAAGGVVLPEYRNSAWFSPRDRLPAVTASHAVTAPQPLSVVLFTIDAMRADVLTKRAQRKRLPGLAKLVDTSIYFSQARSPTPATTTTFASIFSGKYHSMLPWTYLGKGKVDLVEPTPRFAQLLEQAGVRTIQIRTLGRLGAENGVGLGFTSIVPIGRRQGAKEVVDLALEELAKAPGPSFLFAHFTEAHAPYDQAGKKGSAFDRYVGELSIVDRQLARFREQLRATGRDRNTVIMISADHGEAFGEHGQQYHARTVYEELMRVPLIVHVPWLPARRVDEPVSLMDAGPTVLDLFGLPTPGSYMGQSLAPLLAGKPTRLSRPIVADAGRGIQAFYFADGKKVIFERNQKTTEVYDVNADPGELTNLFEVDARRVDPYVQTAELFFRSIRLEHDSASPEVTD